MKLKSKNYSGKISKTIFLSTWVLSEFCKARKYIKIGINQSRSEFHSDSNQALFCDSQFDSDSESKYFKVWIKYLEQSIMKLWHFCSFKNFNYILSLLPIICPTVLIIKKSRSATSLNLKKSNLSNKIWNKTKKFCNRLWFKRIITIILINRYQD